MRGSDQSHGELFSYVNLEQRIPARHPLREMKILVDGVLASMSNEFEQRYASTGRPSIPPERLIRALLIQVLYTVRSERQLVEQLDYNLLFRWFVGLSMDEPVWDRSTFGANRDRLLDEGLMRGFFDRVVGVASWQGLTSDEHFSVDGSLIEAWASHKSFRPKDSDPPPPSGRNPDVDFKGEKRSNKTHQSTTDPESRLFKKGEFTEAKLRYMTHVLSENRNGLVVDVVTTQATGKAEVEAAQQMAQRSLKTGNTLGADKGYDQSGFVGQLKTRGVKGHIARKDKGSAVDGRTARGKGYATSLKCRKRVEEVFGWLKTVGGLRKTRHRGLAKLSGQSLLCYTAYNLVRLRNLMSFSPVPRGIWQ